MLLKYLKSLIYNSVAELRVGMNNELGKRIADIVCQAWNELDASLFESILSDDFEYISVWVLETMKGKDRYMEYI